MVYVMATMAIAMPIAGGRRWHFHFLGHVVVDLARPRWAIVKKRKTPFRSAAKWSIARRDKVIPYSVFWQNKVVKDLLDELRGEKGVEMLCDSAPPIDALAQAFDEYIEDLL